MNTTEIKNPDLKNKTPKKRYFPSSFLIIIGLMAFFAIVSWILKGAGVTTSNADGKSVDIYSVGLLDFLTLFAKGFVDKAEVIIFVLFIGGTLGIIAKTRAVDAAIEAVIIKLKNKVILIIPILMLIFGLGGTTYGMWEETIAFFPILIPIFKKAGFGPFPAVLTILIGAGTGCMASTVNPFAVGVAFGAIKEGNTELIPQSTGLGLRWLTWVIFEIIAITLVTWASIRIRAKKTIITGLDEEYINKQFKVEVKPLKFTLKRKFTVTVFILGFLFLIISYLPWASWIPNLTDNNAYNNPDSFWNKYFFWLASARSNEGANDGFFNTWGSWYFVSVAAIFFLVALITMFINWNDFKSDKNNQEQEFISTFNEGAKDLLPVCILIGAASGLGILLDQTNMSFLIANSVKNLGSVGVVGFLIIIFLLSCLLSFFIPSTSGFAAAFIPIFWSITNLAFKGDANLYNIMSLVILAFLLAEGVVNLFTPTSAPLMAYIQYAGVSYTTWIKYTWKYIAIFFVVSIMLLSIFGATV